MKQLIVTGDDFGHSHEVNEAIERYHEAGFLTQASLMVDEPAAEEAVRIAQRHPTFCVGLHLTLCAGRASGISPITNARAEFCESPARAGLRYAFRSALIAPLQKEICAQFARFRAWNLPPTYWDGHAHLHLHPTVFRLALPVAREHGFRAMRLVREPGPPRLLPAIFAVLSRAALPALNRHGIAFADHTFGLRHTGKMTRSVVTAILQRLPEGLSELYLHPGAEPEELDFAAVHAVLEAREITRRTSLPLAAAPRADAR